MADIISNHSSAASWHCLPGSCLDTQKRTLFCVGVWPLWLVQAEIISCGFQNI